MKRNTSNNNYFKVLPLKSLPVSTEIGKKLQGWKLREEKPKLVDGRTPFFAVKGTDTADVVNQARISGVKGVRPTDRAKIVEQMYHTVLPHISANKDLVEGEDKYMAYRFSSRSVKLPYSAIKEGTVYPYFINAQQPLSDAALRAIESALDIGEESIRKLIPAKSLRLFDFQTASDELPSTTNGGLPYMISGVEVSQGKVTQDNRPMYLKIAKKLAYESISEQDRLQNAFISVGRGQESNDVKDRYEGHVKPKQRRPGAEGHAGTIIGNRMKPFLNKRSQDPRRYALVNQSSVDQIINSAFKTMSSDDWMLAGDGSSYDTGMMPQIALRIADIIIDSFACDSKDREACERYFEHVFSDPLVTPEGILQGLHGMPSGTTFTNELDSCYNEVLSIAVQFLPQSINKIGMKLEMVTDQGDDAVMVIRNVKPDVDTKLIAEVVSDCYKELNMSVNPKKQMISKHKTEFLKRLHSASRVESYRSYVGTTIGMCNMEHDKAGRSDMYSTRFIMQAANHYASLPGFDVFMTKCVEGDIFNHMGEGIEGGAYALFQRAGGVNTVLKRLGATSYATHLGVKVLNGEAKLADSLSSVEGVMRHNKRKIASAGADSKQ